jgi:hypothetical protein
MKRAAADPIIPVPATHIDSGSKTAAPQPEKRARQDSQPDIRGSRKPPILWTGSMHFLLLVVSSTGAEDHGHENQRTWSAI